MRGVTVIHTLQIKCYAAQHLGRDDWVVMEYVWRRENLHGFEEEVCPARASPRGLFHDEYLPKSQDKEKMYVPQPRVLPCDAAVGFGIKLMKALVEIAVVKEVKNLTAVEFDRVDEIFRVVETRHGQGWLVLDRVRSGAGVPIIPTQVVGAAIKEYHGGWQWGLV